MKKEFELSYTASWGRQMYIQHRFSPLWHIKGTGMPWNSSGYTIISDLAGYWLLPWHFLYIDDVFLTFPSICEDPEEWENPNPISKLQYLIIMMNITVYGNSNLSIISEYLLRARHYDVCLSYTSDHPYYNWLFDKWRKKWYSRHEKLRVWFQISSTFPKPTPRL